MTDERTASFAELRAIGEKAAKRWRADGLTDEDIEAMILEEVQAVRAERCAKAKYQGETQ